MSAAAGAVQTGSSLSRLVASFQGLKREHKMIAMAVVVGGALFSMRGGKRDKVEGEKDGKKPAKKEVPFMTRLRVILNVLFTGSGSKRIIFSLSALTFFLVMRTLLSIQVAVVTGEVAQHLVQARWEDFIQSVWKFALTGIPAAVVNALLKYFTKTLSLQTRQKLTKHINNQYIQGVNFYKANYLPASKIENVDQRVTTDVENFTNELSDLYSSIFKPILDIVLNTAKLSGMMGLKAPIIMFLYYIILAQLKIRMLKVLQLKQNTQKESALQGDYRSAHSRLITYAEEIAFFEGGNRELSIITDLSKKLWDHSKLVHRLKAISDVSDQYLVKYGASIMGYFLLCLPVFFPVDPNASRTVSDLTRGYVLNRQLLMDLAGGIGMLLSVTTQIATFAGLTARVSEVMEQVKTLQQDVAGNFSLRTEENKEEKGEAKKITDEWLAEWAKRGEQLRQEHKIHSGHCVKSPSIKEGEIIKMDGVSIVSPDGRLLCKNLTIDVPHGTNVMITGPNGCGKSSMFRVLGELWPPYAGTVTKPPKDDLVFVPQKAYLVMGTLRDQIIYPHSKQQMEALGITDNDLANLLTIVDPVGSILKAWKWDDVREWSTAFSGGQKQRVALARVFYHRPRYAILDECTSAVSSDVEGQIYLTCRKLNITLFTISHRPNLQQYHEYRLAFDGEGNHSWERVINHHSASPVHGH